MFNRSNAIVLAAAAACGISFSAVGSNVMVGPEPELKPRRRAQPIVRRDVGGPRPHQGEREISRRLRQAERDEARQRARAADALVFTAGPRPTHVSRRLRWMA